MSLSFAAFLGSLVGTGIVSLICAFLIFQSTNNKKITGIGFTVIFIFGAIRDLLPFEPWTFWILLVIVTAGLIVFDKKNRHREAVSEAFVQEPSTDKVQPIENIIMESDNNVIAEEKVSEERLVIVSTENIDSVDNLSDEKIFCVKCGLPNKTVSKFCFSCGTQLRLPSGVGK
jgi:hypothetical protein